MTYLVILIKCIEIAYFDQLPCSIVAQTYSVIEVSEPDDCIVVLDGSISLKAKATADRTIVTVTFFVVSETCSQVRGYKAYAGVRVVHSYSHRSFVSRHAGHTSLLLISSERRNTRY